MREEEIMPKKGQGNDVRNIFKLQRKFHRQKKIERNDGAF